MPNRRYRIYNGINSALTAGPVYVATGTSLKTMMQVKFAANATVFGWGYVLDATPTLALKSELIDTGTVGATVTALSAADILRADPGMDAPDLTYTTTGTGYTSTGEGSISATRLLDVGPAMASSMYQRLELDREVGVKSGNVVRLRVTAGATVNMWCWIDIEQK